MPLLIVTKKQRFITLFSSTALVVGQFLFGAPAQLSMANNGQKTGSSQVNNLKRVTAKPGESICKATILVMGSLCPSCIRTLRSRLEETAGVVKVDKCQLLPDCANKSGKRQLAIVLTYDSKQASGETIKATLMQNDMEILSFVSAVPVVAKRKAD